MSGGAWGLSAQPGAVADRLHTWWIVERRGFGRALAGALGWSMLLPVLVGTVSAAAAPATAALLEAVVRRGGPAGVPVALAVGLIVAVAAQRAAAWSSTVLLRRRCELADSAISRCLARAAMSTPRLDAAFSSNQIVSRYPEILAQYVFLAELPGAVLAVVALMVVAVVTAGPIAATAALAGVAVVLAAGYVLTAVESRAAFEVERREATRARLVTTILASASTIARQSLARQAVSAFTAQRAPQASALRRRAVAAAAASGLWTTFELLALVAALAGLGLAGRLADLGPALALLVLVRLLGAQITSVIDVVSCLQDARPVLRALRGRWLDTLDAVPDSRTGLPSGARALVLGAGDADRAVLLRRMTAGPGATTTLLLDRSRPLLPGTVRGVVTLDADVDAERYARALAASGLDGLDETRWVGRDDGLSDGERARIHLAQALYWGPDALLLDDVFAALDPPTAAAVAPAVLGPDPQRAVAFTTTRVELAAWADHVVLLAGDTPRVLPAAEVTEHDLRGVADEDTRARLVALLHEAAPVTYATGAAPGRSPSPEAAGDAADLAYSVPGPLTMLRHALGLYGRGTCALVVVAALVAVAAGIAAAQLADTGAGDLGPLGITTALALLATVTVQAVAGTRAVDRMTTLQHTVLATLLQPGAATVPLARLTTDVHMTEFRASERLQTAVLGVGATAGFFVVSAVTAPVVLAGLLPALAAVAVVVRCARRARARAQVLAVAAREPLLTFAEAALATAPTFAHPAARAALDRRFAALSDAAFHAGRRSLDIRAGLLAAVEIIALVVFGLTVTATLAGTTTATGVTPATLVYLSYAITTGLAGIVERVQQTDALHAMLSRVASLTGHTELAVAAALDTPHGWTDTHAPAATDGRLTLPTTPELTLTVGRPTVLTGPSGAGKSLLLRAAATRPPDAGEPCSVALLDADIPPLGLPIGTFLDPDGVHGATAVARAWHEAHPLAATLPDLGGALDALPHSERQLANLARALLRHPDLLLLDEALSALDAAGERHVLRALGSALPGTATLVVSHRRDNLDILGHEIRLRSTAEPA